MNKKLLVKKAIESKDNAYVPYSNFHVGAAVMTEKGNIYTGCNIESAAYTPTICAERTAIFKAVSEGEKNIIAIAITGDSEYTYPCGVCRQVIREFGRNAKIYIVKSEKEYREYTIDDLLPHSFGPEDLTKGKRKEE
ncbi:MAG: cytidine deaminase [Firmicutes bacterium]|nr:cytidine deaminase [Bacillota bacterium]